MPRRFNILMRVCGIKGARVHERDKEIRGADDGGTDVCAKYVMYETVKECNKSSFLPH